MPNATFLSEESMIWAPDPDMVARGQLDTTGGINPRTHVFFAPTEVEREEWVHVIRKHSVNSVIDNGYRPSPKSLDPLFRR